MGCPSHTVNLIKSTPLWPIGSEHLVGSTGQISMGHAGFFALEPSPPLSSFQWSFLLDCLPRCKVYLIRLWFILGLPAFVWKALSGYRYARFWNDHHHDYQTYGIFWGRMGLQPQNYTFLEHRWRISIILMVTWSRRSDDQSEHVKLINEQGRTRLLSLSGIAISLQRRWESTFTYYRLAFAV